MPSADTVIVNFGALETAISKFQAASTQISTIGTELKSNASMLQGAWKADASTAYAANMDKLTASVNAASETLGNEIANLLKQMKEKEEEAEAVAGRIADSVKDSAAANYAANFV